MDLLSSKVLLIILTILAYGFKYILSYHYAKLVYYYTPLKWSGAKDYCRNHHYRFATIGTTDENNKLMVPSGGSWIGLTDTPSSWKGVMESAQNSWKWSASDTHNRRGYQNWTLNKPDNVNASEYCTIMWNGQWDDASCSDSLPSVCFTGTTNGLKNYTFVSTNMTWDEARSHCRVNYTDLAMIMNKDENAAVASVIPPSTAQRVWLGLFRNPWYWDGDGSSLTNWAPGEPNNHNNTEHCVLIGADGLWRDANCDLERSFFCHEVTLKKKTRHVKLSLQTSANLSDPAVYNQIMQQVGQKFTLEGIHDFKLTWKRVKAQ